MLYKCVHKKFGTILFCKGVDILISLSWALGMLGITESHSDTTTKQLLSISTINKEQVLTHTGYIVNDIIHKEIGRQSSDSWLVKPTFLSINDYISRMQILF